MKEKDKMSSTKLIRWSGLALMLGGIGYAARSIMHPPGETAQYAFYPLWIPSHLLGGIALLLIALGLMGLYARQSEKVGLPGLIAFILSFVGCTLTAGALIFLSVLLIPFLAARGMDSLVDPKGPLFTSSAMQLAVGLSGVSLLLGLLLFAIATLRARVLPRWGAWLVILSVPLGIVAVVLVFFIGTSYQGIIGALVGSVLGLGLAAWGWALWSEKTEMVAQAKPAM
jgi:hypothetical protein